MSDDEKEYKLFNGLIIGGIVGFGALAAFLALKRGKESSLNRIGHAIIHFGQILEDNDVGEPSALQKFEKKIHKNESNVDEIVSWIAGGIHLWKKFKK